MLDLEKITNEINNEVNVDLKVNGDKIILKGELCDFKLFLDELFLELPEDYTFDSVNVCEVTVKKR